MKIISLDDLKRRIDFTNPPTTEEEAVLDQMIEGYSALFENEICRKLQKVERVEEFPGTYCTFWLQAPPVDPECRFRGKRDPHNRN